MLNKALGWVCGLLGAAALFATMSLTFFDVVSRKLWAHSIPGALELTELLMVIVIFSAIPLVSQRAEHVVFDSFDRCWPAPWVRAHRMLINLLCALMLLGLAYLMWRLGLDNSAQNETTAQLKIPKSPFIHGMALMSALTGLLHLFQMIWPNPPSADESERAAL